MQELRRIKTNVIGLDERIQGGIPRGFVVLVAGPSGSMKTSFTMSILYHAVKGQNLKGMYISFEETEEALKGQMRSLGMEPDDAKDLNIVDLSVFRKEAGDEEGMDWLDAFVALTERYKNESGLDILAIDSLDALYSLTHMALPRKQLYHFFRKLKEIGVTTFMISEMPRGSQHFGKYDVEEFLSDSILHLRIKEVEIGSTTSVRRYIGVAKMRRTNHDGDYYPFLIIDDRFELVVE